MMRSVGASIGGRLGLGLVVAATLAGCGESGTAPKPSATPFRGERLVIAAVGDAAVLPVVTAQLGEWRESRSADCQVLDRPVEPSATTGVDVLVFPGERLGDLIDVGALAVLPESAVRPPEPADSDDARADPDSPAVRRGSAPSTPDALQFSDVIPAFRDQVSKYGTDRFALPLGGSALVLVYNRAAFERAANQASARTEGLALTPPATWKDLDRLAVFFHGRDWDGDGAPESGIALALGADPEGVGDAVYLARAAALGQHRDHYSLLFDSDTMAPRLTSPPFVEALEALVALKASGPPGVENFDAEAARAAFHRGDVALLIDRAERAGRWGGEKARKIGVAPLPGSERVFEPVNLAWEPSRPSDRTSYLPHGGGWLVAVASSTSGRRRAAAVDFITYLINPETSNRLRADHAFPMLPVRGSQVGQGLIDPRSTPGVESRVWSEAVSKTLLAPRVLPGLRIPRASGYLSDLSSGRVASSRGRPAAESLRDVARAWTERTRSLGVDRQLWHYRRSLNRLVTPPTPPDRPAP